MKEFVRDLIKAILISIGVLTILVGIIYLGCAAEQYENEKIYNDGICTDCGGNYEFVSAAKYKNTTYYYYVCDDCGKIIELRH